MDRQGYATEVSIARVETMAAPGVGLEDPAPMGPHRYGERGLLGRGGMGEVRLSRDSWIGREVAVKTLKDDAQRALLLREARVQGQLEHPAIVPVYDLGVDASGRDYFTMKRVAGQTLRSVMSSTPRRNKLLGIFRQVCLAVEYAHARGVIHRDLKPDNIMVGDFGEVYVLDWGLARVMDEARVDVPRLRSEAGDVLGTPGYMAPEQIGDADQADPRSDVYSLGVVLFEILARERMHRGGSVPELLLATSSPASRRPSERAPYLDVPPELDMLCERATAPDPGQRVQSARELAQSVERYLEGDRDLEARRNLADEHAAKARSAAKRALEGGPEANEQREFALRESGRALALDPSSPQALRVTTKLLLEPPPELPAQVRSDIEEAANAAMRERARVAAYTFGFFLVLLATFPFWFGIRSWPAYAAVVITTGLTAGIGWFLWKRPLPFGLRRRAILATTGCGFAAIVAASWLTSPIVLVPAFVIGLSVTTMADGLREDVYIYLWLGIAALLVPAALSWAGVLSTIEYRGDDVMLRSLTLQKLPAEPLLHLSALVTYLGASVSVWLSVRGQSDLRERWLLQLWHLRAMTSSPHEDQKRPTTPTP